MKCRDCTRPITIGVTNGVADLYCRGVKVGALWLTPPHECKPYNSCRNPQKPKAVTIKKVKYGRQK
jgi:hypothetical protein